MKAAHNCMPLKYIIPLQWCSYYRNHLSCSFSRRPRETKILAKAGEKRLCSQEAGLREEGSWGRSDTGKDKTQVRGHFFQTDLLPSQSEAGDLSVFSPYLAACCHPGAVSLAQVTSGWRPLVSACGSKDSAHPTEEEGGRFDCQDLEEFSEQGAAPSPICPPPHPPHPSSG